MHSFGLYTRCTNPLWCTHSGTSPKPEAARASAAKILQYSRLMFWILHPYGLEETKSHCTGKLQLSGVPV